jgi:Fur family ferric uptake transcriptional regulator
MDELSPSLTSDWLDLLRTSGYRLTTSRQTLVEIMARSSHVLSALELFDLGRRAHPGLGLVTVYRTLEKLEELGLIQRVHRPGGCHTYLRAAQEHEHLLICTGCGRAFFFAGDDLSGLIAAVAEHTGFKINDHWLQLFGTCEDCQ